MDIFDCDFSNATEAILKSFSAFVIQSLYTMNFGARIGYGFVSYCAFVNDFNIWDIAKKIKYKLAVQKL